MDSILSKCNKPLYKLCDECGIYYKKGTRWYHIKTKNHRRKISKIKISTGPFIIPIALFPEKVAKRLNLS